MVARQQEHLDNGVLISVQVASQLDVVLVPVDAVHATGIVFAQLLQQVLGRIGRFEKVVVVCVRASVHFHLFVENSSVYAGINASEKLDKSSIDQVFLFVVEAALKRHGEAEIDIDGLHLVAIGVVLALLNTKAGRVVRAERV